MRAKGNAGNTVAAFIQVKEKVYGSYGDENTRDKQTTITSV